MAKLLPCITCINAEKPLYHHLHVKSVSKSEKFTIYEHAVKLHI